MQAPLNSGFNYKEKFDAIYNDIASETGVTLIPFITEEIYFDTNNKLSDGIHLNQIGYKKVVDNYILPEMIKVLDWLSKYKNAWWIEDQERALGWKRPHVALREEVIIVAEGL